MKTSLRKALLSDPPLVGLVILLLACAAAGAARAEQRPPSPRLCAALAVYTQATADDWLQRAAIARATLNSHYRTPRVVCMTRAEAVFDQPFNRIRWQNALDAVDAVASGSYELPRACARATAVIPLPADGPGQQCVVRDLAFVEVAL